MKNTFILCAFLALSSFTVAQQSEKYPLGDYTELTDTKPHDSDEIWDKLSAPTQLSWGTTDIRYPKLSIPDVKKSNRWQTNCTSRFGRRRKRRSWCSCISPKDISLIARCSTWWPTACLWKLTWKPNKQRCGRNAPNESILRHECPRGLSEQT